MTAVTEKPTVFEAWSAVMADVQVIGKESRNAQQGFNFRGIDDVLDAVGPVLRKHGVIVVPTAIKHEAERYATKNGGQMINRVVDMAYTVYGPRGDHFDSIVFGEAADSGDKALTKAQSVAFRVFLLQGLSIPTGQPDPDQDSHERATPGVAARTAKAAPPADANPEAQGARDDLKAVAAEQDPPWDLKKVADKFRKVNAGKELKHATSDEVVAFTNTLLAGVVTLDDEDAGKSG